MLIPEAIEDLFYQMVQHLHSIGEVKFENLFVDGTKIEANAGVEDLCAEASNIL